MLDVTYCPVLVQNEPWYKPVTIHGVDGFKSRRSRLTESAYGKPNSFRKRSKIAFAYLSA